MGLTKAELEELVRAIHMDDQSNPLSLGLSREEMTSRFFDASWSAICHRTGRAGKFHQLDDPTPSGRIYHLMFKAFQVEDSGSS